VWSREIDWGSLYDKTCVTKLYGLGDALEWSGINRV